MKDPHDIKTGYLSFDVAERVHGDARLHLADDLKAMGFEAFRVGSTFNVYRDKVPAGSFPSSKLMGRFFRQAVKVKPVSSGRGGKRPGSGRKPLDVDGSIITTVRLTGEQRATFDLLGGVAWLREQLQAVIAGTSN